MLSEPMRGESLGACVSSSPWSTARAAGACSAAADAEALGTPPPAPRLHAGSSDSQSNRASKKRRGKARASYPSRAVASTPTVAFQLALDQRVQDGDRRVQA